MRIPFKITKKEILTFILSLSVFLFLANFAFALEIIYPPVPGAEPPQVFLEKIENGEIPKNQALPLYIKYFYNLLLSISGLVCLFAIVSGGILYLISGGAVEKIKEGRERMLVGVLGTILLLSSYLILNIINPQLLIFGIGREEVAPPVPPTLPPIEEEIPVYVEIPLGWLLERVKTRGEIVEIQAGVVHYLGAEQDVPGHASLKQLAQCLKRLTDECKCSEIDTENCELNDECQGECLGDPCDRPISKNFCSQFDVPDLCTTNLRKAIEQIILKMGQVMSQLSDENERLYKVRVALEQENFRLELAEVLMRDASPAPISRHDIAAIDKKQTRTLELWEKMEPAFSVKEGNIFALSRADKNKEKSVARANLFSNLWLSSGVLIFFIGGLICAKKKRRLFLLFCLIISGLIFPTLLPTRAQEEIGLLSYFLNLPTCPSYNHICSGEHFCKIITGPNEFKICKSADCSGYETFRYDDNYIYHIGDTTWATAEGAVRCDNGHEAYYYNYDQYGVNCSNYTNYTPGAKWVPRRMRVGDSFTSQQSVVGFSKVTGSCCNTRYSGDLYHHMTLIFHGTFILPNGVVVKNGIILRHEVSGENFYFDDEKGWIGFDRGIAGTGAYIHGQVEEDGEDGPPTLCDIVGAWEIGIQPIFPELPEKISDDPATFYIIEEGNEDLIRIIEGVVPEDPFPPDWDPPPTPPPPEDPEAVILNIPGLLQTDLRWNTVKINQCNDTLGTYSPPCTSYNGCGCGPTSLAMILRYFGVDVYPGDVGGRGIAENLEKSKEYFCGIGSSTYGLAQWANKNYSLSFETYSSWDSEGFQAKIREGKPIMTACKHFGRGYGIDAGHISVIKGIEEGFVYFQDSARGELVFAENAVRDYFACYSFHVFSQP